MTTTPFHVLRTLSSPYVYYTALHCTALHWSDQNGGCEITRHISAKRRPGSRCCHPTVFGGPAGSAVVQCSAVQCSAVQCSAVHWCSSAAKQCMGESQERGDGPYRSAVQCSAVQCSAVQCSAAVKCSGRPLSPPVPQKRANIQQEEAAP
jgi:hypothetical protein